MNAKRILAITLLVMLAVVGDVHCQVRRVFLQPTMKELCMAKISMEEYPVQKVLGIFIRTGRVQRSEWFFDNIGMPVTLEREFYYGEEHHNKYDNYGNVIETYALSIKTGDTLGTVYRYSYLYDSLGNITRRINHTCRDTEYFSYTFYPDSSVVEIRNGFKYPKYYVYDTLGNFVYGVDYTRNGSRQESSVQLISDDDCVIRKRDSQGYVVKTILYNDGDYNHGYRMYKRKYTLRPWTGCLQSGDLLFVSDTGGMGQAVKESTGSYTHVALVERSGDSLFIIDATPKHGVARRPFEETFASRMPVDVYRLTIPFDTVAIISRAKALVGSPYDNAFLPDNDAYYCSELIQAAYGTFFKSKPMNWRDADGSLPAYWVEHFKTIGMPVPEGVPGTNPTDMSRTNLLRKL